MHARNNLFAKISEISAKTASRMEDSHLLFSIVKFNAMAATPAVVLESGLSGIFLNSPIVDTFVETVIHRYVIGKGLGSPDMPDCSISDTIGECFP